MVAPTYLFSYWANGKKWHGTLVFITYATTIADADAQFQAAYGIHPVKLPHVGCSLKLSTVTKVNHDS